MARDLSVTRAGITINYVFATKAGRVSTGALKKDICLVCIAGRLLGQTSDDPDPEVDAATDDPYIAISQQTGRRGGGANRGAAYADLLVNMVDAMRFFALEADSPVETITSKPHRWSQHAVWAGPLGDGTLRYYSRLSMAFKIDYEARALQMARKRITSELGLDVRAALEPEPLDDTHAPFDDTLAAGHDPAGSRRVSLEPVST